MQTVKDAREKLKKYYQNASGKAYDFGSDVYTNANNSGMSGTKLEELKSKTRAHLNAYGAYETADKSYDAAMKDIETRRQNATQLRDLQNAETDKTAMRQASVAGSNYELLKRYLPEYNAQSGKGNLGVGSSSYTDAYAAYMAALSESASTAADRKANVLQNYVSAQSDLEREKADATKNKLAAYETADRELSDALASADESLVAKNLEQNNAVKEKALAIMANKTNEDGTYTKESVDKAFNYIKEFSTDEVSADEMIKQLKAETIDNYADEAMLEYGDDAYKSAYKAKWGRLEEGVDMQKMGRYNINFDNGESVKVKLSALTVPYDEMSSSMASRISGMKNGDIVVSQGYYYVVDDLGRDDTKPRLIRINLGYTNRKEKALMDKYAYKIDEVK